VTLLAEQRGRATSRVIAACKDYGITPPTFEERQGFLPVTFRAKLTTGEVTAQVAAQVSEQVSEQVAGQVAGQVTARFSTAKNAENTARQNRNQKSCCKNKILTNSSTKMKKPGHRSAAFTPLQRASDLGEMMSAGVRTVKRTKIRAPVPIFAFFAAQQR